MRHYFISKEHQESDYFTFTTTFQNKSFTFKSCSDVFSKNQVDYGSLVLIKSIIEHGEIFNGKVLDMCCGYGPIGIILSKFLNIDISFALLLIIFSFCSSLQQFQLYLHAYLLDNLSFF